jgi:hypothetical protein
VIQLSSCFQIARARNVNQIPQQIEIMAKGFVKTAKDNKNFKLKTDKYEIEEITGDTFSGRVVQFEIDGGLIQTMFMIGNTEGIWNGQFTGTKERWAEALSILKKFKGESLRWREAVCAFRRSAPSEKKDAHLFERWIDVMLRMSYTIPGGAGARVSPERVCPHYR